MPTHAYTPSYIQDVRFTAKKLPGAEQHFRQNIQLLAKSIDPDLLVDSEAESVRPHCSEMLLAPVFPLFSISFLLRLGATV